MTENEKLEKTTVFYAASGHCCSRFDANPVARTCSTFPLMCGLLFGLGGESLSP